MRVWVVSLNSEWRAGRPAAGVFTSEPKENDLRKLVLQYDQVDEDDEGPGAFGTWTYYEVTETETSEVEEQ